MIISENGLTEMKGTYEDLYCDLGCVLHSFLNEVDIPTCGKEYVKERIYELVDVVLEQIDKKEE